MCKLCGLPGATHHNLSITRRTVQPGTPPVGSSPGAPRHPSPVIAAASARIGVGRGSTPRYVHGRSICSLNVGISVHELNTCATSCRAGTAPVRVGQRAPGCAVRPRTEIPWEPPEETVEHTPQARPLRAARKTRCRSHPGRDAELDGVRDPFAELNQVRWRRRQRGDIVEEAGMVPAGHRS